MKESEFNKLVMSGTHKELFEAIEKYPELMNKYVSQQTFVEDTGMAIPLDDLYYQRLEDRGLEEVVEYSLVDDIK
jgi:hypothetical protein